MLTSPLETLKKYIDQPSGSFDREDVTTMAGIISEDLKGLGFSVDLIPGKKHGPVIRAALGSGTKQLMLMGHMDTVFPHDVYVPYHEIGDQKAMGSGVIDMKGGIVILLYALKKVIPQVDFTAYRLCVLLNSDEEAGSPESHEIILETARGSFAALSFEPSGCAGRLISGRKGVTSVTVTCTGVPGHAGNAYLTSASAVQALCAQITKLYLLRDDARDISFNAGVISGGTAENVVAESAECRCEFRYYNEAFRTELIQKITEFCASEPVPGAKTSLHFGASHPAIDTSPKTQALIDLALAVAKRQGRHFAVERTGGAGDIAIAGQSGIGVLDGLGMIGTGMHTVDETADIALMPAQIEFAAELIKAVCV